MDNETRPRGRRSRVVAVEPPAAAEPAPVPPVLRKGRRPYKAPVYPVAVPQLGRRFREPKHRKPILHPPLV